jgi:hypothetical protein
LGSASVGQGKQVPVILDAAAGTNLYGKPVFMTTTGKATDDDEEIATPFIFSAKQPVANEVIKQNGEVVNGALIDTI